jgi:hypothetical protein
VYVCVYVRVCVCVCGCVVPDFLSVRPPSCSHRWWSVRMRFFAMVAALRLALRKAGTATRVQALARGHRARCCTRRMVAARGLLLFKV